MAPGLGIRLYSKPPDTIVITRLAPDRLVHGTQANLAVVSDAASFIEGDRVVVGAVEYPAQLISPNQINTIAQVVAGAEITILQVHVKRGRSDVVSNQLPLEVI